jgi:hypothetical protein
VYDVQHNVVTWHPSRVSAFGAVPGHRPVPLGQVGPDLSGKYTWRNRAAASWGGVWMGGNWYDPQSAQFLAFDQMGHAAGASLGGYSVFNGNPLAFWDPDGRLARALQDANPLVQFDNGLAQFDAAVRSLGQAVADALADGYSQRLAGYYAGEAAQDRRLQQWGRNFVAEGYDQYWNSLVQGAQREVAGEYWAAGQSGVHHVDPGLQQRQQLSTLLDWTPVVGQLKALPEFIFGTDVVTGQDRSRVGSGVGLALALAPVGLPLRGGGAAVAQTAPRAYSVAFETQLARAQFGLRRSIHFQIANEALQAERAVNPGLAQLVPAPVGWGRPPAGWSWQHATVAQGRGRAGVLHLVPRSQHTPGSPFWPLLHPLPGASGGYSEWAIPAGAPGN